LDQKLYACTGRKVESGRAIFVATIEANYDSNLSDQLKTLKPQLVILDSQSDLGRIEPAAGRAVISTNVCGPGEDCPAFIPPWVAGDQFEASKLVLAQVAPPSQ